MKTLIQLVVEQFENKPNSLSVLSLAVTFAVWALITKHYNVGLYMLVLSGLAAFFYRKDFSLSKILDSFIFVCSVFFLLGLGYAIFSFGTYSGSQEHGVGLGVMAVSMSTAVCLFKLRNKFD